ncbi:ACP S-malonyltransferase [Priestia aryabhattai]|uniref:ACP S-malonyltransferase n=1 Tax=Priestia aryabhattai TaxID=412384 RepID=UPI003D28585C
MQKLALLFPGQGSQIIGMGKELYEGYEIVKDTFEEANETLGFNIRNLCFKGDFKELTQTENTQPALLTTGVAMYRVYMKEFGIKPTVALGHSLGEYSALTCSNAIEFPDALNIVRKRGLLMQQANNLGMGKMVAVHDINHNIINEEIEKISTKENPVVIACYNSPNQNVISGHVSAIDKVVDRLENLGASVFPLKVSAAFHSPLMKVAADNLKIELSKYKYNSPDWQVISNVNALPYESSIDIIENLTQQMTAPVMWSNSIREIDKYGINISVELGPKMVLKNLMQENLPRIPVFPFNNKQEVKNLREKIMLLSTNTEKEDIKTRLNIISKCLVTAVCTKNSNWDADIYREGVIEPYRKIKSIYEKLEEYGNDPSDKDIISALEMLNKVLNTKNIEISEQKKIFSNLFNKTDIELIIPQLKKYQTKLKTDELITI